MCWPYQVSRSSLPPGTKIIVCPSKIPENVLDFLGCRVRPAGFGKRFTTAATPDSLGRFHRIYQLRGNTGFNKQIYWEYKNNYSDKYFANVTAKCLYRSFTQGQRIPKNKTPTVFSS